jgi:hypothetical protein
VIGWLRQIEAFLQSAIDGGAGLTRADVEPLDLVRQIEREIDRHKKVFVNDQTYVPHKLLIHLYAPGPSKVEEYEALFNNRDFKQYLAQYIRERGYKLLGPIRIALECHEERLPQFGKRGCFVEFSWPQVGADPGELTVVLDPDDAGRIASMGGTGSEVPAEAWLEVIEGRAYRARVAISRTEFNIGRTENVFDHSGERLLRTNHLAFERPFEGDVVNRSVSRQHARILYRDGAFRLYDTGSQNGTSMHRGTSVLCLPRPTPLADGLVLEDGDVVAIGRTRVAFHAGAIPTEVPALADGTAPKRPW